MPLPGLNKSDFESCRVLTPGMWMSERRNASIIAAMVEVEVKNAKSLGSCFFEEKHIGVRVAQVCFILYILYMCIYTVAFIKQHMHIH